VLKRTHKLQNVRNPLVESLLNINANGLTVMASFIIGFDGEERGVADRICSLVEDANIPLVVVNLLVAGPNTRLWHRLKQEGRLLGLIDDGILNRAELNYIPSRPRSEIVEEAARACERLYEPSRFLARTYRYYLNMRPTRLALAIQKGESPPREGPPRKRPFRRTLLHAWAFAHLVWWLGILSPYRGRFWKQLLGIRRQNPSRLGKYLMALFLCLDLHRFSKKVLRDLRTANQVDESATDVTSLSGDE
jgi:radical SAM superfamily enzyme YgiQ (UPF0313 family)